MKMYAWNVGNDGQDTIAVVASGVDAARETIIARIDAVSQSLHSTKIRYAVKNYVPTEYAVGEPMIVLGL